MASNAKESPVGQLRGSDGCYIGIMYDYKLTGEPITAPHLRACPLRQHHLRKMISGVLSTRESGDVMHAGDLFMLLAAGRHGNESTLMSGFVKESDGKVMAKTKKTVHVFFSEESVSARRSLVRGTAALPQAPSSILAIISRGAQRELANTYEPTCLSLRPMVWATSLRKPSRQYQNSKLKWHAIVCSRA